MGLSRVYLDISSKRPRKLHAGHQFRTGKVDRHRIVSGGIKMSRVERKRTDSLLASLICLIKSNKIKQENHPSLEQSEYGVERTG